MEKIVSLKDYNDDVKKEVARIMREETFYSIRPCDVKIKAYTTGSATYQSKLWVESENGQEINQVEIICTIYPWEDAYEIIVNK